MTHHTVRLWGSTGRIIGFSVARKEKFLGRGTGKMRCELAKDGEKEERGVQSREIAMKVMRQAREIRGDRLKVT